MPKYKITWQESINCWMELEADSEEEALERFKDGNFTSKENDSVDSGPGCGMRNIRARLIEGDE